jgi:hypothetical protein
MSWTNVQPLVQAQPSDETVGSRWKSTVIIAVIVLATGAVLIDFLLLR